MRVLCLDCHLGIDEDTREFGSSVSLYDYDIVFWRPASTLAKYSLYAETYMGKKCLRDDDSARLINDVTRRRKEFREFLELGRSLVVFMPGDLGVYVATGEHKYSGTGRNRQTTRMVRPFDMLSAIPIDLATTAGSGTSMVAASSAMASLFRQTRECWSYRCVIDETPTLRPLLYIQGTQKTVAAMLKVKDSPGRLLLLPELTLPWDYDEDDDEEGPDGEDVAAGRESDGESDGTPDEVESGPEEDDPWPGDLLIHWVESLSAEPDSAIPSWASDYQFPSEAARVEGLTSLANSMAELQAQVDQLKAEQAIDERWKLLVTGAGVPLERRVREALELIGFEMREGETGRSDLRGERGDNHIVVEVKGVTKSAAEKNAAQLEKWVSAELAEGISAKGLLVVNTYREMPLSDRREDSFPDQMLRYSAQRGHCLMSGLQLLSMVRTILDDPSRADEIASIILETVGTVPNWDDLAAVFVSDTSIEGDDPATTGREIESPSVEGESTTPQEDE